MTRTFVLGVLGAAAGIVAVVTVAALGPAPAPASPAVPAQQHGALHLGPREPAPTAEPAPIRTAADELIRATRRNATRWSDVDDAVAGGYQSIGDAVTGFEHYVHPPRVADATTLDPRRPESLVYRVAGERRTLVSAMYILPPGSTMADAPDLGDDRAIWHRHRDLCWDSDGRVVGLYRRGRCVPAGVRVVTPPMLHVWIADQPCGPFAGLEGHGDGCH